jgi:hypothetical protein
MASGCEETKHSAASFAPDDEWLQTDGRGGFASGTVGTVPTRRYHALLLTSTTPPTGRMVLVNGIDAWVEQKAGTTTLSTRRYVASNIVADHCTVCCVSFRCPGRAGTFGWKAAKD